LFYNLRWSRKWVLHESLSLGLAHDLHRLYQYLHIKGSWEALTGVQLQRLKVFGQFLRHFAFQVYCLTPLQVELSGRMPDVYENVEGVEGVKERRLERGEDERIN
jgi:hypothetical protein